MQVASILSRLSDLTGFGHPKQPVESTGRATLDAAASVLPSSSVGSSKLQEILSRYDVSDITPRSFSELLQALHQAGFLPESDLQELSQVRLDLERQGIGPDERVNLVETYAKKLLALQADSKELEEKLGASGLQTLQTAIRRRLDWLEKLLAIHRSPEAATINALA